MAESFEDLSQEMAEAREALRSFTLGQEGLTQQDGVEAISRVTPLCEQLQKQFGSGRHASEVANMIVMARNQVQAAKARLTILQRRETASVAHNGKKR